MTGLASLLQTIGEDVDFSHIVDRQLAGVRDEDWIPQIADDGWIVITADRGKRKKSGTGERLPIICERFGVTYAAFSRSISQKNTSFKIRALHSVFPELKALPGELRGSGFSIRPRTTRHDETQVALKRLQWILDATDRYPAYIPPTKQTSFPGMLEK